MNSKSHGQRLAWMQWVLRRDLPSGGVFAAAEVVDEPKRLWTLIDATDKANPPKLPIIPVHRENAFSEDKIHDWSWRNGKLHYYTRVMDRSCWVLLEME